MKRNNALNRIFMVMIYFFLYAPIFILIIFSFNDSKSRTVWSGFTFDWYVKLFENGTIMHSIYITLLVSVLAAGIATVFGTMAALGFFNMKKRWRSPLMTINNIPLYNADIVTGVSMCLLFVSAGAMFNFTLGFGTLLAAHITFNIPYVILSVMPKLYQLDKHLVDAAQDLGCTGVQAFFKVVLPQIMPGVINGAMIAFTMSLDDFVISYFTAGSSVDAQTLSMTIYSMTRKRVTPEVNAVSTLLFLTVLILLVAITMRESNQAARREKLLKKR